MNALGVVRVVVVAAAAAPADVAVEVGFDTAPEPDRGLNPMVVGGDMLRSPDDAVIGGGLNFVPSLAAVAPLVLREPAKPSSLLLLPLDVDRDGGTNAACPAVAATVAAGMVGEMSASG